MTPAHTQGAHARRTPRRAPARHRAARPASPINWDRIGRLALLTVLVVIVLLYIKPAIGLLESVRESGHRQQELSKLEQRNGELRRRREALNDPQTLEREARRLGKVRPGERGYVIEGLPRN